MKMLGYGIVRAQKRYNHAHIQWKWKDSNELSMRIFSSVLTKKNRNRTQMLYFIHLLDRPNSTQQNRTKQIQNDMKTQRKKKKVEK